MDVARHDEDISPELIATIESVHLICIDAHVALTFELRTDEAAPS